MITATLIDEIERLLVFWVDFNDRDHELGPVDGVAVFKLNTETGSELI